MKLLEWSKENSSREIDLETSESIEYHTTVLYNDILYKSLEEAVGIKEHRNKNCKWFWNKELKSSANTRQYYYRKWLKAPGINKARWW